MQLNIVAVHCFDDRLHRRLVQRDRRVRHLDRQRFRFQSKDVVHGADGQRHFFRFQPGHIDLRRAVSFELLFKLVLIDRLDLHGTIVRLSIVGGAVLRLIADTLPLGGVDRRLACVQLSIVKHGGKLMQIAERIKLIFLAVRIRAHKARQCKAVAVEHGLELVRVHVAPARLIRQKDNDIAVARTVRRYRAVAVEEDLPLTLTVVEAASVLRIGRTSAYIIPVPSRIRSCHRANEASKFRTHG